MNETADDAGLQAQLLGIRDVLPGTSAAHAEVRAAWTDTMRRRAHDLEERRRALPRPVQRHEDSFAWNREGNGDDLAAMTRHSVAGGVEVLDVEDDLSHARSLI